MRLLHPPLTLATMQRLNAANLPHTATILAPVVADLPGGGTSTTYTPTITLPCRLSALGNTPPERVIADQLGVPEDADVVVFAAGAVVDPACRLRVDGTTLQAGGPAVPWTKTLAVAGTTAPVTGEVLRKVVCTEIAEPPAEAP